MMVIKNTKTALIFLLLTGMLRLAPLNSASADKPSFSDRCLQTVWSLQKKIGAGIVSLGISALAALSTYKIAGHKGFSTPQQRALTISVGILGAGFSWVYWAIIRPQYELEYLTDTVISMLCNSKDPQDLKEAWSKLYYNLNNKKYMNVVAKNSLDKKLVQLLNLAFLKFIDRSNINGDSRNGNMIIHHSVTLDLTELYIIRELYKHLPKHTLQKYDALTLQQFLEKLHTIEYSDYDKKRDESMAYVIAQVIEKHDHGYLDFIQAVESLNPQVVKKAVEKLPPFEKKKKIESALVMIEGALYTNLRSKHSSFDERVRLLLYESTNELIKILNILMADYQDLSNDARDILERIFQKVAPFANKDLINQMKHCLTAQTVMRLYTTHDIIQTTLTDGTCEALEEIANAPQTRTILTNVLENSGNVPENSGDGFDHDKIILLMSYGFPFDIVKYAKASRADDFCVRDIVRLLGIKINTLKREWPQHGGLLAKLFHEYSQDPMGTRKKIVESATPEKREYYQSLVSRRWHYSTDHDERIILAKILNDVFNDPRAEQENIQLLSTKLEKGKSQGANAIRGSFTGKNNQPITDIIHGYLGSEEEEQTPAPAQPPSDASRFQPSMLDSRTEDEKGEPITQPSTEHASTQLRIQPEVQQVPHSGDQLDEKHSYTSGKSTTSTTGNAPTNTQQRSPKEIAQIKRTLRDKKELKKFLLRGGRTHNRAELRAQKRREG